MRGFNETKGKAGLLKDVRGRRTGGRGDRPMLRPDDGARADRDHRAGRFVHLQQFEREHGAHDVDHCIDAACFVEMRLISVVGQRLPFFEPIDRREGAFGDARR